MVALSKVGSCITLSSFQEYSLQGDAALQSIYQHFGVKTQFKNNTIILLKEKEVSKSKSIFLNLNSTPDLAQTIAVTCLGLGLACNLTGLHTLKIKETNRLQALQTEMQKLGAKVQITDNALQLHPQTGLRKNISIATYQDHRMAMAFAPLALKIPIVIQDAHVVSKSYPNFWNDLKSLGFQFSK